MNVDRNEKIWAYSNNGTKVHAFVQAWRDKDGDESTNHLRAMCRGTIARHADAVYTGKDESNVRYSICPNCLKKAEAMWGRAEASMTPATESDDLGYVAPVDEDVETEAPVIIAVDEAGAVLARAERQAARNAAHRLSNPPQVSAHAEALAEDAEHEAWDAYEAAALNGAIDRLASRLNETLPVPPTAMPRRAAATDPEASRRVRDNIRNAVNLRW